MSSVPIAELEELEKSLIGIAEDRERSGYKHNGACYRNAATLVEELIEEHKDD